MASADVVTKKLDLEHSDDDALGFDIRFNDRSAFFKIMDFTSDFFNGLPHDGDYEHQGIVQ